MYNSFFKRMLDIFFCLTLLPMVALIIAIVAPIIFLEDRGNIFYVAKRRGLNGKIFNMYKLRTMKMNAPDIRNADNSTFNSVDDIRLTKVGKILRTISIDELPQIINIIRGDMSWIGPRPVTIEKPLEDYDLKRIERLKVRPGITGYAQAYFRNNIEQEEKLELDSNYAKCVSFLLDLKIIFQTIRIVINREGIYKS